MITRKHIANAIGLFGPHTFFAISRDNCQFKIFLITAYYSISPGGGGNFADKNKFLGIVGNVESANIKISALDLSLQRRVRHLFPKDVLNIILNSLIFSKLLYYSTVWSSTFKQNIKKLPLLPRLLTDTRKYYPIRATHREYSSKPLKDSIVERILVFKR